METETPTASTFAARPFLFVKENTNKIARPTANLQKSLRPVHGFRLVMNLDEIFKNAHARLRKKDKIWTSNRLAMWKEKRKE